MTGIDRVIDTAVILAGGFGTRLAAVVSDVPKPMAPIAGRPFLERLLDRLASQGIGRAVLAVGYRSQAIRDHFGSGRAGMQLQYSEEPEPLGTGGALRLAFESQDLQQAIALNGDTWCDVELRALSRTHAAARTAATLTLVHQTDASRFGTVEVDDRGRVAGFREKRSDAGPGLINAGVYALDRAVFDLAPAGARFSFENDVLQARAAEGLFAAHVARNATFIDIGVPDDYARAQTLLAHA